MFKKQSLFPDTMSDQARNAFWMLLIFPIAYITVFGLYLFLYFQTGAWQLLILTIVVAVLIVAAVIALYLNRSGKRALAGILDITAMALILPVTSVLLSGGIGIVLGMITVAVASMVSGMFLSGKHLARTNAVGIVSGLASILLDLFWPFSRFSSPTLNTFVPVIAILSIIAFAIFVIRQFRDYSLRTKQLVALLGVSLLVMVVFGFVSYLTTRARILADVGTLLQTKADAQGRVMGDFLTKQVDTLTTLSSRFRDTAANANAAYTGSTAEIQSGIQQLDTQWIAADQAKNDHDPLVSSRLNNPTATILNEYRQGFPENVEVFLTDQYGALIAATNRTSDYNQGDEAWWQTAYNNGAGKVYIGEMEFDESSQTFAANIAVPLYAADSKRVIGVLRTTVTTQAIVDFLKASLQGTEGVRTDILFPSGNILAEKGLEERSAEEQAVLRAVAHPYSEFTYEGDPSFVSTSAIQSNNPDISGVGWLLVIHEHSQVALAPVDAQLRTIILIGLVIAGLSAGFAFLMARSLSRPVIELTGVAEKVAAGDLTAEAKVESSDEVGQLATTFNSMTRQLRDLIGTLEQRVAERTHSLELAADVGRAVSQVRSLDLLLKDAVELIRSQFGLYYAQVYLTNPYQTELVLQAGTGSVGVELIGRSHRLPLNTGSINGRAATEKRSVIISDTTISPTFRPNPLLPDTRSEMAVPLLVGEKVVGVLDMQSAQAGALSEESLPAFEALAGQLAIAIQNASLLAETNQARAEVEAQARRLARTGWQDYLDALHMPEHTGFVFEKNQIQSIEEPQESQHLEGVGALTASISVTGEQLGELIVEIGEEKQSTQTVELVNIVARQVSQQIENLRLLDSAQRYRFEAEQASRRLTREGWQDYMQNQAGENLGYLYDLKEVKPYNQSLTQVSEESAFTLPLKVRNEAIGKLSIMGLEPNDGEAIALVNAVSERLGAQIESLRQFDQAQSALAQSEKLFEASRSLTQATDLQELVKAVVATLNIPVVNRAHLEAFNYDAAGELAGMTLVATWWNGTGHEDESVGRYVSADVLKGISLFLIPTPMFVNDPLHDERMDPAALQMVKAQNTRALAILPLFLGTRPLGMLILTAEEPHIFTQDQTRLFTALAPQIATVLENRRQFERAQKQAERESMLNIISQKIQGATSVEAVLQIAARELGHALGAPRTIAQLSIKDKK